MGLLGGEPGLVGFLKLLLRRLGGWEGACEGELEVGDAVGCAVVLMESNGEGGPGGVVEGGAEGEIGVVILVERFLWGVDGPAGGRVSIEGVGDGEFGLLDGGSGIDESDFLRGSGVVEGGGGDFDPGEDEVAVLGAAGSFAIECEGVEAEGGDVFGSCFEGGGVGVFVRGGSGEVGGGAFDFDGGSGGDFLKSLGSEGELAGGGGPFGGKFGEEFFGLGEVGFLAVGNGGVGDVVVGLDGVIEVGHEAEVVVVGDRVVFMGVALGAAGGEAEPGGAGGGDAVGHGVEAELEGVDAAFFIEHGVAVKAGGGDLFRSGIGKHVAGELLDGKLIESFIGVERFNDVVAVGPDGAVAVFFVAVGIGVAGEVEPAAGPAFAVVGRFQEVIDDDGEGLGGWVGGELVGDFDGRRKADEVEVDAADEGVGIGLGGEVVFEEVIDGVGVGGDG